MDGGSFWLLGVIRDHRGAIEYDFRARFGLSLTVIGRDMTVSEAARLTRILASDPATQTAAAIEGWAYPFSRELAATTDLWDLQYAKTGAKKAARYPRPDRADQPTQTTHRGNAAGRSPDEVKALLREHPAPV